MRVGIIEIMETGHLELAETICRIYCSDPANMVYFLTIEKHAGNMKPLCDRYPNLEVIPGAAGDTGCIFARADSLSLDRVYLVTLIRYFRETAAWKSRSKFFLTVHNLDEWFGHSFISGACKFFDSFFHNFSLKLIAYSFKVNFIYPRYKKMILGNVRESGGKLVVLSESVHNELLKLKPGIPSEVLPFSVYDPAIGDVGEAITGGPLKICVPGILSQYRRDYLGLLDMLEEKLSAVKDEFSIDFLGGVNTDNPLDKAQLIIKRIEKLQAKGFNITYHSVRFIPSQEYEKELSHADIILGNMNIDLNKFSRYGKTKETGLPFAMIKAGKAGILPDDYPYPAGLSSGVISYHSKSEIAGILAGLIKDRGQLDILKRNAIENSIKFTPAAIYKKLVHN